MQKANKYRDINKNRDGIETVEILSCAMNLLVTYEFKLFIALHRIGFVSKRAKVRSINGNVSEKDRLGLTYRRRTSIRKNKTHKSENYCFQFIKFHSIHFFLVHSLYTIAAICVMATSCYSKRCHWFSQFDWICIYILRFKLTKQDLNSKSIRGYRIVSNKIVSKKDEIKHQTNRNGPKK